MRRGTLVILSFLGFVGEGVFFSFFRGWWHWDWKIFAYIDVRESAKRRVKPDNISMSIFINIFTYFIIHIYSIINSIVSLIFVTSVSYIIAPIYVMSISF